MQVRNINNNPLTFKANNMSAQTIYALPKRHERVKQNVAFVKFEPTNEDIAALNSFHEQILQRHTIYSTQDFKGDNNIYGITTQNNSFDKLEPKKILGIMRTTGDNDLILEMKLRPEVKKPPKFDIVDYILYFGRPRFSNNGQRTYERVGTALIEGLKSLTDKIKVISNKRDIGFFIKNGFTNPFLHDKKYLSWIKK